MPGRQLPVGIEAESLANGLGPFTAFSYAEERMLLNERHCFLPYLDPVRRAAVFKIDEGHASIMANNE